MDIEIYIVKLTHAKFDEYVSQIKASNLPKPIQIGLIDLLETALAQTQQAKNMGWL